MKVTCSDISELAIPYTHFKLSFYNILLVEMIGKSCLLLFWMLTSPSKITLQRDTVHVYIQDLHIPFIIITLTRYLFDVILRRVIMAIKKI